MYRNSAAIGTTSPVRLRRFMRVFAGFALVLLGASVTQAADKPPEVEEAIRKGAAFIAGGGAESEVGVLAYALIAAGRPADDLGVKPLIERILQKINGSEYTAKGHHIYEAGVDAMALAAADKEKYRGQLEIIAGYLMKNQRENGSWDYPNQNNGGDTSISQYGMLGLWAAARAGIQVPKRVWDRAAAWHMKTQKSDGSFAYQPLGADVGPKHSMTVAGVGSMCIARIYLFETQTSIDVEPEEEAKAKKPEKTFGVLEKVNPAEVGDVPTDDAKPEVNPDLNYKVVTSRKDLEARIKGGMGWLGSKYTIDKPIGWTKYYLYGLERACALTRSEKVGNRDWYREGYTHLIATQAADGSWSNDPGGALATTAFGVLFLCRATDKIAPPPSKPPPVKKAPTFGGGVLAGGRGLPTDLSAVENKDGQLTAKKLDTPLDKLLADLENPQAKNLEVTQNSIVQAVQVGDRETLIGKKDLLVRLSRDKRIDVRRTAYWALGRCNDLRLAPKLIEGLLDEDYDAAVEARNALCVLSRRPRGFGLPDDLIAKLPENASQVEKETAFEKWRREDYDKWKRWYQSVRPYEERDQLAD